MSAIPNRPLLRYHGGKFRLADWIISQMPNHTIYCEPFGGGASVLLRKPRVATECYNDLSKEVVTVFRVMQDEDKMKKLQHKLKYTPFARDEYELACEYTDDDIELARRVIVRLWFGFATSGARDAKSGFRSFYKGGERSPATAWAEYPDVLTYYCARLQGVYIENRPAVEVIRKFDSDETLFYVDPPYLRDTRKSVGRCYEYEMSDAEHEKLLRYLLGVKGKVMISGYNNDIYNDYLIGWAKTTKTVQAAGRKGGTNREEVLWLSPNTEIGGLFGGVAC